MGYKSNSAMLKFKHNIPEHLRRSQPDMPGPAEYELPSSIKKNNRKNNILGDSTWQRGKFDLRSHPKENPGPGHYRLEDGPVFEASNKSATLAPGYTFPISG